MSLQRRARLKANQETTRAWRDGTRGALEASKDRNRAASQRAVRDAVFARDGHRCVLADRVGAMVSTGRGIVVEVPRCYGGLTFHHRRKAGAGGAYIEANGLTLCAGHNEWVEDEPDAAAAIDRRLVVREGDPGWGQLGSRAARGK